MVHVTCKMYSSKIKMSPLGLTQQSYLTSDYLVVAVQVWFCFFKMLLCRLRGHALWLWIRCKTWTSQLVTCEEPEGTVMDAYVCIGMHSYTQTHPHNHTHVTHTHAHSHIITLTQTHTRTHAYGHTCIHMHRHA